MSIKHGDHMCTPPSPLIPGVSRLPIQLLTGNKYVDDGQFRHSKSQTVMFCALFTHGDLCFSSSYDFFVIILTINNLEDDHNSVRSPEVH